MWGTGPFTGDSGICSAAIFAGAITDGGGVVNLAWAQGQNSYAGGSQFGVTTYSYTAFPISLNILLCTLSKLFRTVAAP